MQSEVTHSADFYKLWAWFEKNKKQVTLGAGIVAVVGLGVWFFVWRQSEKQVNAGIALSKVFVPQTSSANRTENADGFLKVASEHAGTKAAERALLLGAGALFTQGKYTEAQAQFEKFLREHRGSPLTSQAALGVAASLEAQNKTNEALTAYKTLVDRHPNESVIPQAKFSLARLYEAQNKPELARPLFEEVARLDPYGSLGSEAGMRLEELKAKHPELANPAPAATSAVTVAPTTNVPPAAVEKK